VFKYVLLGRWWVRPINAHCHLQYILRP